MSKDPILVVAHDGSSISGALKTSLEGGVIGDRLLVRCGESRRHGRCSCGAQVASVSVCTDGCEVLFIRRRALDRCFQAEVRVETPDDSTVARRGRLTEGGAVTFDKQRSDLWEYAWLLSDAPPTIATRCSRCNASLTLSPREWPRGDPVRKDRRQVATVTVRIR